MIISAENGRKSRLSESNFLSVRSLSVSRGGERPPGGEDESPWDAHNDDDVVERHPGHVNEVHRQYLVPQLVKLNILRLTRPL